MLIELWMSAIKEGLISLNNHMERSFRLWLEGKGPDFATLKKNKVELSDDERAEVMKSKAVWHHGLKGALSPAVWKSEVNGKTWYVTNTHRAFNSKPTLKGAIGRYHDFIKSTA